MGENLFCYYHKNNKAVENCERCHKLICLADKRTYTNRTSTRGYNNHYYNTFETKYIYCPPCYYEVFEGNYNQFNKIQSIQKPFLIIFMIPFILVPLFMISMITNGPFGGGGGFDIFILFPIFFIFVAIFIFAFTFKSQNMVNKTLSEENNRLNDDKRNFHQSIGMDNKFKDSYRQNNLICFQCGSPIEKKDLFCSVCGDSTKDELEAIS